MKIGYLVMDGYSDKPEFWTTKPDSWMTYKVIVYMEVDDEQL